MDVTVEVKGLAVLEARLLELDALVGRKLMRRVLRRVAKPVTDRARANAVSIGRSGALARSVATVTRRERGREVAHVAVTSRANDRVAITMHNQTYNRRRKGIFYGWMVEKGHAVRTSARDGSGGKVQGRPWFWPAITAAQGQFGPSFVREMDSALARLKRRQSKSPSPDALVPE